MRSTIDAAPVSLDGASMDPVVRQVVRSRLIAITDQMRLALQSVSGSPTVTEASDFFTGIYLPDGSFVTMGHQVTFEAPPVGALIRHLLSNGTRLKDGDRIIGNDPFVGALHQNDVQMCAPLIVDGELLGWAGVMAHETDLGGMDFASWSPKATEVFQEGLRIPAVKLVDGGELREDVLEMILTASRLPAQVGLDIRAFIATLNVAAERLTELSQRYGKPTVLSVMHAMVDDAEALVRARLRELPDGVVHTRDFLEHDGHSDVLYAIDCVLTKRGDSLHFDFSGSSGQAQGFVNCSRAGLAGGVAGAVIPTLGFGIPWNEGMLRPVEIAAPDGLVCTAVPPAPVGSATVEAVWTVSNVVSAALNRLLLASPRYAHRAQAVNSGTMATFNLSGRDRHGQVFGLHLMDPLAGGFGAFADHDGQNAAGPINAPCPSIADVEVNEQKNPLFYAYRRLAPDTGGAGRRRGGLGAEVGLTVSVPQAEALVMTHGAEVPNSAGIGGGLPGGLISQRFTVSGGSPTELGPKPGSFPITPDDLFEVTWQGGGGLGDPLDRDPGDVLADVRYGVVSAVSAVETYGVVLDESGDEVDAVATAAARRSIRAARLGVDAGSVPDPSPVTDGPVDGRVRLADRLVVAPGGFGQWEVRTTDGAVLSRGSTRWRDGAHRFELSLPPAAGDTLHPDLTVTGWACPATGALLAVDVHLRDEEPFSDLDLDLNSLGGGAR
ncbi:hydantoinase B/oxoprolinase family protein [Geodermatophilus sp. TF02-6]|uniref:hydantoinase B/oxoprolinase family protein n=1 Tax=Geodermatophilus sp. TF02-6 TaxID=2250575 RepID=UPI000DE92F71|nr:hydantoinase B/oxoprolinase family protein [Geodermatophilus sp. TF02-6]RBY79854.1 hydantoinase B/oxoprolinase family protein [Geodermatophilus sp. TF02-6]